MLNGIPINDQSATNGMHDFWSGFIQTIQQIEVYKGSNGALFGPDAIGGAINFVTDIDYTNSLSFNGFSTKNNSVDYNATKITDRGWHLNLKELQIKVKLIVQLQKVMSQMEQKIIKLI